MPTYVYECSNCTKTFEVEQRITENPLTDCPCGAKGTVKRVIQPVGIAFKGSGFHINDYSSNPSTAETTTPSVPACTSEPASCPACSTDKPE